MTPRRTRRRVASCAAVLSVLAASPLAAQKATTPDFSGTWVLDSIKSDFAGTPVPKNDTSKITRVGNVYHMEQVGDFGPRAGGLQRLTYSWPAGNGEVTNDLPQGGTMHVKTKLSADTSTFFVEMSAQGRLLMRQSGRTYLAERGTLLVRGIDVQPMQGEDLEPIHLRVVYDKK